jgi:hypothetical protein
MENKNKIWCEKDLEILKKYYPLYGSEYCSELLKRDKKAIVVKAKRLEITFSGTRYKYSCENLKPIVEKSKTIKEVLDFMGLRAAGGNYKVIKNYITKYNLDIKHFEDYKTERIKRLVDNVKLCQKPLNKILVIDSSYSRTHLKKRLYEDGLKKHECEMCGQGEVWNGNKMSLILDHINGIHNDNRIENLRIVCPNCNATLNTHAGKNNKK